MKINQSTYCSEDVKNIKNYDVALNDTSKTKYVIHHRKELELMPDGSIIRRSVEELKSLGLYYNRPAEELIILREREHSMIHSSTTNDKCLRYMLKKYM